MPSDLTPFFDPAISLAQAMVTTSDTPLLMLDGDLTVLAASSTFCRAFGLEAARVVGNSVLAMGDGQWRLPRLESLLTATSSGGADVDKYEMDLKGRDGGEARSLELSAHKLDYGQTDTIRMLLSVADTTIARASAKELQLLVADNLLLLQEVQHRVANSLQIIASVLMQSARRVTNDETRSHLQMAQNRVLSIAAIQEQLSQKGADDVALRPYLAQLCLSLGASMIADPELLSIETDVDDVSVPAAISVSLGLIVTEVVINALKHAYPIDSGGTITVRYTVANGCWSLEVADDGVGMRKKKGPARAGLGTSIIEALSRQLQARIVMTDRQPGTSVLIVHEIPSITGADPMPVMDAV